MTRKIRVLIVDDHPVFLEGLQTILSLKDPMIVVVGVAENGFEAVEKDMRLNPDVILMDIVMPDSDGIEAVKKLKQRRAEVKVIMLTTFDDRDLISRAIEAGASGYLLKDAHASQIIEAIKAASEKNVLLSDRLALKLSSQQRTASEVETGNHSRVPKRAELHELTERTREILVLIARGKTNTEIGEVLFLSEKTIRNYVSHIYSILNVHTRTQAALWAKDNLR